MGYPRIMFENALLLGVLYQAVGLSVELARKLFPSGLAERACLAIDALPARVLEKAGLMGPLRQLYFEGQITEVGLRVAFGATGLAVIFAMALLVTAASAAARRVFRQTIR